MGYLHKKQNLFQKILFSRGMALGILFAVVFFGFSLISIIGKSIDASRARKIAENQAVDLQKQQTTLSAKIDELNTQNGQEAILREQFPVVKAGEHVVVITGDDTQESSASQGNGAASSSTQNQKQGFWNFLKNIFH